ncbi:MAG: hypothetical protein DRM99_00425 [Thermoplasmata archaeon]|nr:MAG: hypothetical protein DRM99_00425 [Thermoplasmata archaeon]
MVNAKIQKIIVANPPWPGRGYGVRSNSRWPHKRGDKILPYPIYLAYLVSVLRKRGFKVAGIDAVVQELSIKSFTNKVAAMQPDAIVIEVATPSFDYDIETFRQIKARMKDVILVMIGTHGSIKYEEIMEKYPFVDYIVRGEFDYTVPELFDAINKKKKLSSVDGLVYKEKKILKVNKDRNLIMNLDELPYPARDVFKIEHYQQGWYMRKTGLLITSRGCPSRCTFCVWPEILYGHKFRMRSPKSIVDEMEYLVKELGVQEIDFDDDTFTTNPKHVEGICKEILARGLKVPWRCFARVSGLTKELLMLMKKAGCYYLCFGVESGSPIILQNVKKGISLEQAIKVTKWCRELKLRTHATYMFGLTGETPNTIRQTINFAKMLDTDTVQFSIAMPFPGTKFFQEMEEKGYIDYKRWSDFDGTKGPIIHTDKISKKDFSRIISKAYREYFFRPKFVIRNVFGVKNILDIRLLLRGLRTVLSRVFFY